MAGLHACPHQIHIGRPQMLKDTRFHSRKYNKPVESFDMDNFIAQVNETFSQVLEMRGPPPQRDSTNLTGMDIRQRIKDTRHNTRINKGDAVPVKYRLQELQIVEVKFTTAEAVEDSDSVDDCGIEFSNPEYEEDQNTNNASDGNDGLFVFNGNSDGDSSDGDSDCETEDGEVESSNDDDCPFTFAADSDAESNIDEDSDSDAESSETSSYESDDESETNDDCPFTFSPNFDAGSSASAEDSNGDEDKPTYFSNAESSDNDDGGEDEGDNKIHALRTLCESYFSSSEDEDHHTSIAFFASTYPSTTSSRSNSIPHQASTNPTTPDASTPKSLSARNPSPTPSLKRKLGNEASTDNETAAHTHPAKRFVRFSLSAPAYMPEPAWYADAWATQEERERQEERQEMARFESVQAYILAKISRGGVSRAKLGGKAVRG